MEPSSKGSDPIERALALVKQVPLLAQAIRRGECSLESLVASMAPREFYAGEYIFTQGQSGSRDLFFVERGRVALTKRRTDKLHAQVRHAIPIAGKKRSPSETESEMLIEVVESHEYFGETPLLSGTNLRPTNAVALPSEIKASEAEKESDELPAVSCLVMDEDAFALLLKPLHELMYARSLLRTHRVLDRERLFRAWRPLQRRYILERCEFARFAPGTRICEQRDTHDDRFFIVIEGEADVVLDEADDNAESSDPYNPCANRDNSERDTRAVESAVLARKGPFQSFGEMALLGRARVASVIAVGSPSDNDGGMTSRSTGIACIVITRALYLAAKRLREESSKSTALLDQGVREGLNADEEEEAALASMLADEWTLATNARRLRLSNPRVARHLVTFIQRFKAAYQQLFEGKSAYLDLLRRLRDESALIRGGDDETKGELSPLVEKIIASLALDASMQIPLTVASLGVVRSETRRVLALPSNARSTSDTALVTRLIERSALINKIERPSHVSSLQVARVLAQVVTFVRASKGQLLFRQGRVESRAFLILRGKIAIVNERGASGSEVLATLGAGDSFGELSLVAKLRRSASAMAPLSADLIAFDREHLAHLQRALPGVSVQHVMVERAEFLARLSFMKPPKSMTPSEIEEGASEDAFGECIRVAHDVVERTFDPRHRFFQDQVDRRVLFIVKSGEVGVFVRKLVPSQPSIQNAAGTTFAINRPALVRVATIGPQEFFGATIATISASPGSTVNEDISAMELGTVYMSCSHLQVLELPERGWRRLGPTSPSQIRSALLERHKWNAEVADHQRYFYHADRPWQLLGTSSAGGDKCVAISRASAGAKCQEMVEPVATTQLARHLKDKKQRAGHDSAFSRLFTEVPAINDHSTIAATNVFTGPRRTTQVEALPVLAVCPTSPRTSVEPVSLQQLSPTGISFSTSFRSPPMTWEGAMSPRTTLKPASSHLGGSFSSRDALLRDSSEAPIAGSTMQHIPPNHRHVVLIAPPQGSAVQHSSPRTLKGREKLRCQHPTSSNTNSTALSQSSDKFQAMWKLERRTSLQ